MNLSKNRMALLIGGFLSAILTVVFFVIPAIVPIDDVKRLLWQHFRYSPHGNPFTDLRALGGFPGAFLAGYFASDEFGRNRWGTAGWYGALAAVGGMLLVYVIYVVVVLARWLLIHTTFPPLSSMILLPLIVAFPFGIIYLAEGFVAGMIGNAMRLLRDQYRRSTG